MCSQMAFVGYGDYTWAKNVGNISSCQAALKFSIIHIQSMFLVLIRVGHELGGMMRAFAHYLE